MGKIINEDEKFIAAVNDSALMSAFIAASDGEFSKGDVKIVGNAMLALSDYKPVGIDEEMALAYLVDFDATSGTNVDTDNKELLLLIRRNFLLNSYLSKTLKTLSLSDLHRLSEMLLGVLNAFPVKVPGACGNLKRIFELTKSDAT